MERSVRKTVIMDKAYSDLINKSIKTNIDFIEKRGIKTNFDINKILTYSENILRNLKYEIDKRDNIIDEVNIVRIAEYGCINSTIGNKYLNKWFRQGWYTAFTQADIKNIIRISNCRSIALDLQVITEQLKFYSKIVRKVNKTIKKVNNKSRKHFGFDFLKVIK